MCNKVGYPTKEAALKDAKVILADIRRYKRVSQKVKKMNVYLCRYCGQFHLTKQKQKKRKW